MLDLTSGQIQVLLVPVGGAMSQLRDSRIRLLAVMTSKRAASMPDVPTAAEEGHPELTVEAQLGFFGSKALSEDLRERIASDVRRLANDSSIRDRLRNAGMEACASTPAEYGASLRDQAAHWTSLARAYGIRARP
jgi:tripartite-type tricarboxylate transporter receptor subunit TctC